mmetsp:Transcript_9366/g.28558  ORF Transcript_9366/g.28558 Transcript_9366/m.28558 type:complete len:233 (+) Transcript_9366:201-899(+)
MRASRRLPPSCHGTSRCSWTTCRMRSFGRRMARRCGTLWTASPQLPPAYKRRVTAAARSSWRSARARSLTIQLPAERLTDALLLPFRPATAIVATTQCTLAQRATWTWTSAWASAASRRHRPQIGLLLRSTAWTTSPSRMSPRSCARCTAMPTRGWSRCCGTLLRACTQRTTAIHTIMASTAAMQSASWLMSRSRFRRSGSVNLLATPPTSVRSFLRCWDRCRRRSTTTATS